MEQQKAVIGLPRAMLYYRYGILWRALFPGLWMGDAPRDPPHPENLEQGAAPALPPTLPIPPTYLPRREGPPGGGVNMRKEVP